MTAVTSMAAKKLLEHMLGVAQWPFPTGAYVALFSAGPVWDEATATLGTEVSGGGYVRQPIVPDALAVGDLDVANAASIRFTDMPATDVVGIGVFTDAVDGELLLYDDYDAAVTVVVGQRFVVLAGDLLIGLS